MPRGPLQFHHLLGRRAWHHARHGMLLCLLRLPLTAETAPPAEEFRLGFSSMLFSNVNENDARGSLRALAAVISRERHIATNADVLLLRGTRELASALRGGRVDAAAITSIEYWVLCRELHFNRCMAAVHDGDPAEEYVLLVNRQSGYQQIEQLRGKRLAVCTSSRMRLGFLWCDVLLARQGLAPPHHYFAQFALSPKASKVVLDVFFGQADACLVSRRGFRTVMELNPKVGAQLTVLASSPAIVPELFIFRETFTGPFADRAIREFCSMHLSPAGKQALMIFQAGEAREQSLAILDSALSLLDEFARLRPEAATHLTEETQRGSDGFFNSAPP